MLLIEVGSNHWYHNEVPPADFTKLISPRLRWIQLCSSDIGHVIDTGLVPGQVVLTNAAGVHADALGENVMVAILFHAKHLAERLENQREKA